MLDSIRNYLSIGSESSAREAFIVARFDVVVADNGDDGVGGVVVVVSLLCWCQAANIEGCEARVDVDWFDNNDGDDVVAAAPFVATNFCLFISFFVLIDENGCYVN